MNELLDYFAELAEEAGMDSVAEELRESCPRYVIDQRAGCIAVVDTHHPRYPSGQGLHRDYPEVVKFWGGRKCKRADGYGFHAWYVTGGAVTAARRLARKLNGVDAALTKAGCGEEGGVSVHIYSPHGYYLAQIRPAGCRKWRTIKGARGDRKFRLVSKAVIAAAKNMRNGLRARVIFCAEWHDPLVAWEARWT